MTLSQTATLTKQIITLTIIAIVLGTVSFIGYKIWYAYYLAHLPPVEEKPDLKFGILPSPEFSNSTVSSSNFSYSIDTVTGGLPKLGVDAGFDKLIKVYFITKTFTTLLSAERAQILADKLEIKASPQNLSASKYVFTSDDKNLDVDLDTGNFAYQQTIKSPSADSLEEDTKLISNFKTLLTNLDVFKQNLNSGRNKVNHLENNIAEISIWPNGIDGKPIMTAEFNRSSINATVIKNALSIDNYLSINFIYYPIDTSTYSTYPLKTPDQALEDLKSGKGSVVIEPAKPQVSITSVYLAYFLGASYSPYLLPIYVFEGPQFASYVPAIIEQYQSPAR